MKLPFAMPKRSTLIATGLTVLVGLGLVFSRTPETPITPSGPDAALEKARAIIAALEARSDVDPNQAAIELDAAAATLRASSPQAAAELRAAADRYRERARGGTAPTPQKLSTPGQLALANDEVVVSTLSFTGLPPAIVPIGTSNGIMVVDKVLPDELGGYLAAFLHPILGRLPTPGGIFRGTAKRADVRAVIRNGNVIAEKA